MKTKIKCVICRKETPAKRSDKKYCKECLYKIKSEYTKKWVIKNPEKRREIDLRRDPKKIKEWYLKQRRGDLAEVTKFRDRVRYWEKKKEDPNYFKLKKRKEYIKRRELYRKNALEYREENKEKVQIAKKLYRASEQGKLSSQKDCRNRRARIKKVVHNFTLKEWKNKLKQTKGYCPSCNKFVGILKLSLDHTLPISKVKEGFIYTINEVNPLCKSCNSKKYNKI